MNTQEQEKQKEQEAKDSRHEYSDKAKADFAYLAAILKNPPTAWSRIWLR